MMPGFPYGLHMIDALLPPLSSEEQTAMVVAEMRQRNALGITSTRELAVWPEAFSALKRIRAEGKFTLRMAVGIEFPDHEHALQHIEKLPPPDRTDPWLFLDAIGEEPWTPGVVPKETFTTLVTAMRQRGWRPAPHVSSDHARGIDADLATDSTLDAYEAVDRVLPIRGERWYVEHVPFATAGERERMERLGLIVSVQDAAFLVAGHAPLGPERMAHQNPVAALLAASITVVGGSDYSGPVPGRSTVNNPMRIMEFLVTRRSADGSASTAAEKIDRLTALRLFTRDAAYAVFQENERGRIASGLLADFVILDRDFLSVPADEIDTIRPRVTFVGGRRVYTASGEKLAGGS